MILSRRSPGADLTGQKVRSVLSLGSGSVLTGDTDLAPDPPLNNYNNNLYSYLTRAISRMGGTCLIS